MAEEELAKELIELFEQKDLIEIDVSARVLDLIASFVDSSTKLEYDFNKPPFLKILHDGSYWRYGPKKCKGLDYMDCSCVEFVTWKHSLTICLRFKIIVYWDQVYEFDTSTQTLFHVIFTSYKRQRKIKLFDVYRKLLFYENLEKNYYMNVEQQQNS
ncbi:MAG: hypothetical protein QXU90_00520 [Acidilobaceae archaeon]